MTPSSYSGLSGRYRSISAKLNFILLLTVVITFVCAGFVLNSWLSKRLESRGIAELQQVNRQVVDMIEAYASALEKSAETLGASFAGGLSKTVSVDVSRSVQTGEAMLPALRFGDQVLNNNVELVDQFNKATGGVATLFIRHNDDFYRVTTSLRNTKGDRVIGTALGAKHPAYQRLIDGKPYTGPAVLFGHNYMTRYTPILDTSGKTIAVSFIGLDFTEGLQALKSKVRALKVGESGYSFVLDSTKEPGMAIIHPAAEGKSLIDVKDQFGTPIIRQLLDLKSGELRYWWQNSELGETSPREKVTVIATFDKWGWVVGTGSYIDEFSREVVTVRWYLALTGLVILLALGLAIFWATHHWVTKPLSKALEVTEKVAAGDLTQHITADSNDEVGKLLSSLDGMSEHLREMISEVDAGIKHLAGNAHQLTEASSTVAQGSGEQSRAATTMAATVEEMSASINQVAMHAESCRDMASHSGDVSDNGISVINQAIEGMTRIANTVGQSSEAVSHLGDESQQISHIVNVIREIAEQTNLLALNAAIEAARAGEAGRGFAVVADEVRKLAERTTLSTQEITQMVTRIQEGAVRAVDSMHQGEAQVADGVTLANEAGSKISEIKIGADQVTRAVIGISDALREQNTANQEIARNVERIAEQAEINHQQAQRTADTALGMETLAEQLRASIARFRT